MTPIIIIIIVAGALLLICVGIYNSLVQLRNGVDAAWSNIDTFLKKRYDLVPNLVETVKGYAKHESDVFTKVTAARSNAMQSGPEGKSAAEGEFAKTLKSLFAVAESYPDLKANQNFLALQTSLSNLETEINESRTTYNASVNQYNNGREVFPNVLFANMFGFTKKELFELGKIEERENVDVRF